MATLIGDLQNPNVMPDYTESVSVVQTHISIVFVTDEFVYKIKKPVNFGFLDFSSLRKRHYFCQREIELNDRLSEGIYLDVLPVVLKNGTHTLRSVKGKVVDYAVKMKRIPDSKLMKSVFAAGKLTERHLRAIAKSLSSFHQNAQSSNEINEYGTIKKFRINTDENFEQVEKYVGMTVPRRKYIGIKKWTDDFYATNEGIFEKRIADGRIRDCHGDLHMEHICFTEPPCIIDCIEFNDRFRYSDSLADIAFLLMDLEYHGGEKYAESLWRYYKKFSKEKDSDTLLTFYKVYRAFVRGKVNSFQIDDDTIGPQRKREAEKKASRYFELAYTYINEKISQ